MQTPAQSGTTENPVDTRSMDARLKAYAVAASAAGVTMLALATPSAAEIVYTPAHTVLPTNSMLQIDLNNDGLADFVVLQDARYFKGPPFGNVYSVTVGVSPYRQNRVVNSQVPFFAQDLHRGQRIGAGLPFRSNFGAMGDNVESSNGCTPVGPWNNEKNGFLGLVFSIGGQRHYGWARFSITQAECGRGWTVILTGYAYETVPDTAILAGQIKDSSNPAGAAVPGSLGALAAGR